MACGGEVDDRKTAMSYSQRSIGEDTFSVGPAMGNRIGHPTQENRRSRFADHPGLNTALTIIATLKHPGPYELWDEEDENVS